MSFLDTIKTLAGQVIDSPLTQQGLEAGLSLIPPPWGIIIGAAAHGLPTAIKLVTRAAGGEQISDDEVNAAWPQIQAEAIQVGKDWDASESEKRQV